MRGATENGFTLIELVLALVLLGIIAAVVSQFVLQGVRSYSVEQNRGDVHAQARLAVERVLREARDIRSCADIVAPVNPSAVLSYIDTSGNPVAFGVAGGSLSRGADQLAQGVTSTAPFSYLDRNGAPTTSCVAPNDIWFVEIDLTCAQGGESLRLRSRVRPRNFQ